MAHSVLSVSCRALLAACGRLGLSETALQEKVGIDRRAIDDPDGRVAPDKVFELFQEAERASGDPHLALRVAEAIPVGSYRVLEYLLTSAPHLGAAFAQVSEYFPWIDTSAQLPLVEVDGLLGLSIQVAAPPAHVPLRAVEFTFGTCLAKARAVAGADLTPTRLEVAGPPPADPQPLRAFFRCPITFGAPDNRMLFERRIWERPLPTRDPSLFALLSGHARKLAEAVSSEVELQARVRRVLSETGPHRSLAEVAKDLGLSTRTLQRRLAEAGLRFASIADEARAEVARSLVESAEVAILEVAFLLGFSDQSSFTRSFKRWTGMTPAAYRTKGAATPPRRGAGP